MKNCHSLNNSLIFFQASKLTQQQITEYKGVFEMFDEEGNGDVKTQELERLMSLMGINPTKRELVQMAKDVDKDGEYEPAMTVNPRYMETYHSLKYI